MIDAGQIPDEPPPGVLRRSYIARHWRGELNLPVSYFANGMLVGFVSFVLIKALAPMIGRIGTPVGVFAAIVGIWLLALSIALWQAVGIWRSASRHPARGGNKGWAVAAKTMVVIGTLQAVYLFGASGIPQIREGIQIVRGDPSMGAHTVRVLNNGTELELAGGITVGVAREIERVLAENPDIHTVHLNSGGGRIAEAENIRNLIEQRGLDTYVATECLSACTIAYLGGKRRFIDPDAKLGFHAGTYPGLLEADLAAVVRSLIDAAIDRGVDPEFAEMAYMQESGEFWKPDHSALLAAGFVTEISDGRFAISGFGVNFTREDVADQLRTVPMFETLARIDPPRFDQVTMVFYEGALAGTPLGEVTARSRSVVGNLLIAYAPLASNELLVETIRLLIDELRVLEAKSSDACFAYLYPELGGLVDLRNYAPPELWQRDLELTEKVIASGAANEAQHAQPGDSAKAFDASLALMIDRHGDEVLADVIALSTNLDGMDKAKVCRTVLIIYEAVLEQHPDDAAALMRELLAPAAQP